MNGTPELYQTVGEIAAIVSVSAITAVGGYLKGAGKIFGRKPEQTDCKVCPEHPQMAITLQTVHEDLKELAHKFDRFLDEKWEAMSSELWSVIRSHERKLGQLQGRTGLVDHDTKQIGY